MSSPPPKRFYSAVTVIPGDAGWSVQLDARPIMTPARAALVLPAQALAQAVAGEWEAQTASIDMASMTLTKLANVAIDRTPETRDALADELARYAETDVICHLAEGPAPLRERQSEGWQKWREWAGKRLDIVLVPVEGVVAAVQPQASLDAARDHALRLDDFRLTALVWGCSLFGSAVLALAVEQGALGASDALKLASIDEDWQIETWGDDEEAASFRAVREKEAAALGLWFAALAA